MNKEDHEYRGRCVWGYTQDFYRDYSKDHEVYTEWFRLWEELSDEEQQRYISVGDAFATVYGHLAEKVSDLNQQMERLSALIRKESRPR